MCLSLKGGKNETESLKDMDINKKLQWTIVLQNKKKFEVDKIKIHVLCFKKTYNHPLKPHHLFKRELQLHTQTLTLINGDYTGKKFIETFLW